MKLVNPFFCVMAFGMPLALTGCTQNESPSAATTTNSSASVATPAGTKSIKVAVTTSTPPFSFLDDKGNPQGIDIDMINAIAKSEGFTVIYQPTSWTGLFTQVGNKTSDLAVSGISFTEERNGKYALSHSYLFNPAGFVYKKGAISPKTISDLKGLKVSFISGSKFDAIIPSMGASQVDHPTTPYLTFQQIVTNKSDVGLYDTVVLQHIAKNNGIKDVEVVPFESESEPMTQTVVLLNKDNAGLLTKINRGIDQLKSSGELARIQQKWVGTSSK